MTEISQQELRRTLERLENAITRLDDKREEVPNFKDLEVRLSPIEKDLKALQDANKWIVRTATGALLLAVLDPMLRLLGAG